MDVNVIFAVIRAFLQGCVDSFKGIISLYYIDRKINERIEHEKSRTSTSSRHEKRISPPARVQDGKVLKRVAQCCGLNGGVFLLSLLFFEYVLLPFLESLLFIVLGEDSSASHWVTFLLSTVFSTCWVLPLLVLSKIVNFLWCQDIAESAFWSTSGKQPSWNTLSQFCADTVFSFAIQYLFLLQSVIIGYIPMGHLGQVLTLVHISLLYSLYAFEYRWCKLGWELHKRLMFVEANWPYFIGFGLPLAFFTTRLTSSIQNGCIFAVLFPLFIISANNAKPVTQVCNFPLQLFSIAVAISNTICDQTLKRTSSVRRQGQRSVGTANVK